MGGAVLARLSLHPKIRDYDFTVYLRSPEKAKGFKGLGYETALGSLDDVDKLEKLAAKFDIVFQTVSYLVDRWGVVGDRREMFWGVYRPTLITSREPMRFLGA